MKSIKDYSDLIKLIPVNYQSSIIKKEVWGKFSDDEDIIKSIFIGKDIVELSRADVFSEKDITRKLFTILMWGYPTGGRGNNIGLILKHKNDLIELLENINGKDLTKEDASSQIKKFKNISGVGNSTWSKFLYFFGTSIDSKKCQIYDTKIVNSLNRNQLNEFATIKWKQDIKHYYQYIELVDNLATDMDVLPEQVELFLFYFNLYYKFV